MHTVNITLYGLISKMVMVARHKVVIRFTVAVLWENNLYFSRVEQNGVFVLLYIPYVFFSISTKPV